MTLSKACQTRAPPAVHVHGPLRGLEGKLALGPSEGPKRARTSLERKLTPIGWRPSGHFPGRSSSINVATVSDDGRHSRGNTIFCAVQVDLLRRSSGTRSIVTVRISRIAPWDHVILSIAG